MSEPTVECKLAYSKKTVSLKQDSEFASVTNYPSPIIDNPDLSNDQKIAVIETHFREIMRTLGLDLNDPSLAKTPNRVAKMYVQEVFSGLDRNTFPSVTFVPDRFQSEEDSNIVLVKVGFTSFCEHHFVPMHGTAHVAYLPNGRLIGLSKIARVVRFFARRPQLQERLTAQIADSIRILLNTEHVAVSLTATHFCVVARGVEDEAGTATTQVLKGNFRSDETLRKQFLEGIGK